MKTFGFVLLKGLMHPLACIQFLANYQAFCQGTPKKPEGTLVENGCSTLSYFSYTLVLTAAGQNTMKQGYMYLLCLVEQILGNKTHYSGLLQIFILKQRF